MIVSGRNLIVKLCFSIFASLHLCLCICICVFLFVLEHICFSRICVYCNSKTVVCGAVAHFRKATKLLIQEQTKQLHTKLSNYNQFCKYLE